MKAAIFILVALTAFVAADHTLGTGFSTVTLTALGDNAQEVAVCGSGELATAFCQFTRPSSLFCAVSHDVVGATAAHLHNGPVGSNGGVVFPFTGALDNHFEETFTFTQDSDITDFLNGNFYLNIHTAACPSGTVRGQFDAGHNVYSNLNGNNEVPPSGASTTGVAVGIFDSAILTLQNVIHTDVNPITAAHIHNAPAGSNGGVIFGFTDLTNEINEMFTLDTSQTRELFGHNYYYNIHSPTFGSGEVRGQLAVADAIPRINYAFGLDGNQEVPPSGSGESGCANIWVDGTTGFMEYSIHHNVVNPTAAHIHLGAAGTNGAPVITLPTATSPITGSATLSAAQMDQLADGDFYVNIHSTTFGPGSIRGQIVQDHNKYAYLSGTQENPSITTASTGCAYLDFSGSSVTYTIFHDVPNPTNAHFHFGTVGNNGAVRYTLSGFTSPIIGTQTGLSASEQTELDSDSWYINIHSSENPSGEIRGQVLAIAPALVSGGGGDPHFWGFDGSDYDLRGASGSVYNLITDSDIQVNFQLTEFEKISAVYNSFIGSMGFVTSLGDSVIVDAGSDEVESSFTINGEFVAADDFQGVEGRSFSIKRVENHAVPKRLGFGNWHEVSAVFQVAFDRYSFEIFLIDTFGVASGELRFIDFTTALRGFGHNPEGTLGRTLQNEAAREVTSADDFLVQDGILGTDFRFNRFQME